MRILPLLLLAVPLGCGNADATRAGMQVVAKVNGTEIAAAEAPSAQALEQAIERELLVQKAREAGRERDPAGAPAIDRARRPGLARARLERRAPPARSP
ncbi:MAG: hypothetical protein ACT4P3_14160, partial [Betaproteobacteria bacterium]